MADTFAIPEGLRSLGNPLGVHPPRMGTGRSGYFTMAAVLAALAGLAAIGMVNPPGENTAPHAVFIVLTMLCAIGAAMLCALGLIRPESATLILFPEGLAQIAGSKSEIFRWSEIREIYEYIHPMGWWHKVVAQDGRKLHINSWVKDGKQLGQALEQAWVDRMLPAAIKAFDGGQTLAFGNLKLNQNSLMYKDKRIAWEEIGKMTLLYNAYTRSVQFEVRARSGFLPWCVVRTQDIPNLNIFKMLAERKRAFTR